MQASVAVELQHAAVAHLRRIVGFDAPDRRDDVAVDAVGFLHRVELRLVFGEDLAALGEAVVVHEDVEIVPDRLGEFGLRIHQVHDAQVGREPRGEALEIRLRDVAACGIGPHRGDAIWKIRRRLPDRARGHQRMAGGAVLAAPGRRRRRPGRARPAAPGADFWPEKMLPKKFETPLLPEDWAWDGLTKTAWLEHTSAAAIMIAPVRLVIARSVRPMPCPSAASHPRFRRPSRFPIA